MINQDYDIDYDKIPKERLSLAIILILFLMHSELTFPEIVLASGIEPSSVLECLENLQRLRFIKIIKKNEKEIYYKLIGKAEAFSYLEQLKVIRKRKPDLSS